LLRRSLIAGAARFSVGFFFIIYLVPVAGVPMHDLKRRLGYAVCVLALASQIGCEKVQEMFGSAKEAANTGVQQATQAVENAAETVRQTAGVAGTMQLTLDGPVQASGCYATLNAFSDGRPSVLQITSYNNPSAESFPSVILRATTKSKTLDELAGETVSAQCFVQTSADGPIWQASDKPLNLEISLSDGSVVEAAVSGTLINVQTGDSKEISGTVTGNVVAQN
jgi:hypothetical protein